MRRLNHRIYVTSKSPIVKWIMGSWSAVPVTYDSFWNERPCEGISYRIVRSYGIYRDTPSYRCWNRTYEWNSGHTNFRIQQCISIGLLGRLKMSDSILEVFFKVVVLVFLMRSFVMFSWLSMGVMKHPM